MSAGSATACAPRPPAARSSSRPSRGGVYVDRETGEPLEVVGQGASRWRREPVAAAVVAVENLRFCNWCDQLAQTDSATATCGRRMEPWAVPARHATDYGGSSYAPSCHGNRPHAPRHRRPLGLRRRRRLARRRPEEDGRADRARERVDRHLGGVERQHLDDVRRRRCVLHDAVRHSTQHDGHGRDRQRQRRDALHRLLWERHGSSGGTSGTATGNSGAATGGTGAATGGTGSSGTSTGTSTTNSGGFSDFCSQNPGACPG